MKRALIIVAVLLLASFNFVAAQEETSSNASTSASTNASSPDPSPAPAPNNNNSHVIESIIPTCPEGFNLVDGQCEAPVYQSEDNVQFNDSDLAVSLFKVENEDGSVVLDFYDTTNNATQGEFLFSLTPDVLAPFIGNPPAENTALFEGGHLGVYVLSTGEVQVNVGPDSEGKIHVRIFDAIPWTHFYGYTIDPV